MYRDLKLSDRARVIEMAVKSGITDLNTIEEVYNTFAKGGDLEEPAERRKVGDHYLTLEQYKELQRDTIRQAAIQKAITRREGIFPIINGEVGKSCIYTATDNFGRKYRVAGNQTFFANPEKYGFEVNGPIENARPGDLYQLFNNKGVPDHMNMITGEDTNHNLLVSYSSGYAGFPSMSRGDYKVNAPMFDKAGYETYRFIGTPDDNAKWQSEWMEGSSVPLVMEMPEVLNNQVNMFKDGGTIHIKKKNRGKFTALKKRTGHSASWFKAHGTPAQKKMATFALNARKWKHSEGGLMTKF